MGLLLLSALWALASLRAELFPAFGTDSRSAAARQAALFSVFAAVAASVARARRVEFPRGRRAWAYAGIGLGLFVVPAVLVACAEGWIPSLDRVAVFSLTSVFAIVLEPYMQGSEPRQGKAALAGALAGVAGILFLLGLDIPRSFRAGAALSVLLVAALIIAATYCLAVRLAHNLASRSTLPMARRQAPPAQSALPQPPRLGPIAHGAGAHCLFNFSGSVSPTFLRCSCSFG
jgi:drug/metabolite transporter (DMT)-like permease